MHIVIFGASGMIGSGALLECLDSEDVTSVRVVGRSPTGRSHPKLTEIQHGDLTDLGPIEDQLRGFDACLWCLGVSAGGRTEEAYRRVTIDFTRAAAEVLLRLNPGIAMCFISGAGTSRDSRQMWARTKAEAEDLLSGMGFARLVHFRPAGIQPKRGVVSKTPSYRLMYRVMWPLLGLLRALIPSQMTDSVTLGRALIRGAKGESPKDVLENGDINALGA